MPCRTCRRPATGSLGLREPQTARALTSEAVEDSDGPGPETMTQGLVRTEDSEWTVRDSDGPRPRGLSLGGGVPRGPREVSTQTRK